MEMGEVLDGEAVESGDHNVDVKSKVIRGGAVLRRLQRRSEPVNGRGIRRECHHTQHHAQASVDRPHHEGCVAKDHRVIEVGAHLGCQNRSIVQ